MFISTKNTCSINNHQPHKQLRNSEEPGHTALLAVSRYWLSHEAELTAPPRRGISADLQAEGNLHQLLATAVNSQHKSRL